MNWIPTVCINRVRLRAAEFVPVDLIIGARLRSSHSVDAPFKTELGSMSVPTLEAIHEMMPSKDWQVINDDWAEHDFCAGAQQGDIYPDILQERYGRLASLADFVRKAQMANYEGYRAMYEGRLAKLFNPVTGVITWMSNPAQPSFAWQLYSHDLEPNGSLFGVRKACEPVHIQMNQKNWHIEIINNTPEALKNMKARTMLFNLDGSAQDTHAATVSATPSAATDLGAIAFPGDLSPVHFVKLELRDAQDYLVSENFYWRADPERANNFQALNELPAVALDVQATRHESSGKCLLDVSLHNPTKSVALMAHLQLRKANSGQRVLPVFYSDNYISLLPNETRTLTIEAAEKDLAGEAPLLAVDGWNVTAVPEQGAGDLVAVEPNVEALVADTETRSSPGLPPAALSINCGGSRLGFFRFGVSPAEGFVHDRNYKGGGTATTSNAIGAYGTNAAPEAVYQSERWGSCVYSIPARKGYSYSVLLHFAEAKYGPGCRKFNVDINGRRVLENLDIAAEAGKNEAIVKRFSGISPDDGHIVIAFGKGSLDEPKICGIQIIPESVR